MQGPLTVEDGSKAQCFATSMLRQAGRQAGRRRGGVELTNPLTAIKNLVILGAFSSLISDEIACASEG